MIATFTSLASRPSLDLATSAMKAVEAAPNWSEWTWARNVYCRLRSFTTAVAMAVVIQKIFF